MNKKGFTLTELITVLTILTVISTIIFPIVRNYLIDSEEKALNIQINKIISATEDWMLKDYNTLSLPENEGEIITITLGDLKIGGHIPVNVKNPKTKELFPDDMLITITKKMNDYNIDVLIDTGTVNMETTEFSPEIILKGNYLIYVELNDNYVEPGYIATSNFGINLSDMVKKTIYYDNNQVLSIDTSKLATYVIHYTITDNDLTSKIIRTVIVRDKTSPVINFSEIVTISLNEVNNFDFLKDVTVTDNSNENVNITYTGELKNVPGKYLIIYKATDKSGNVTERKRIIEVKK